MLFGRSFSSLLLILGLVLTTACGRGNGDYDVSSGDQEVYDKVQVQCDLPEGCALGVGMLFFKYPADPSGKTHKGKLAQCSASYIGNRRILTNNHCARHLTQGEVTEGSMKIIFPGFGSKGPDAAGVTQLLNLSPFQQYGLSEDYALLEIDHDPERTPVELYSESHLPAGTKIRSVRVTPTLDTYSRGRLHATECTTIEGDLLNPTGGIDGSANISFEGCQLMPGNSGSPLLNERGQMVAISQAVINGESIPKKHPLYLFPEGKFELISFGTSVACMDILGRPVHPFCASSVNLSVRARTKKILLAEQMITVRQLAEQDEYVGQVGRVDAPEFEWTLFGKYEKGSNNMWDVSSATNYFQYYRLPTCLKSGKKWQAGERKILIEKRGIKVGVDYAFRITHTSPGPVYEDPTDNTFVLSQSKKDKNLALRSEKNFTDSRHLFLTDMQSCDQMSDSQVTFASRSDYLKPSSDPQLASTEIPSDWSLPVRQAFSGLKLETKSLMKEY